MTKGLMQRMKTEKQVGVEWRISRMRFSTGTRPSDSLAIRLSNLVFCIPYYKEGARSWRKNRAWEMID